MGMNKHWKNIEKKVALFFGSERTPLSGGNSKHTRSDSLHKQLFIETKYRVKHSVITLYDQVKELAKKEKKTPVICLAQKGKEGFWIVVHSKDLKEVAKLLD